MGDTRWRGDKGENWENYNSIINKIYIKNIKFPQPSTLSAPDIQPSTSSGSVIQNHQKQMIFLLKYRQKVNGSLMLHQNACHSPHFISSCRQFIISHHHKNSACSTIIYFERDYIHMTFITVYYYNCSILLLAIVVNLLICLIYKLNFIIGMYV